MSHYLMQIDLDTLRNATVQYFDPEQAEWKSSWTEKGGTKYVAQYSNGQANISGPVMVAGQQWFEILGAYQSVIDQISALANESMEMHEAITSRGPIQGAYRLLSAPGLDNPRRLIRKQNGKPVGVMCDFTICGRDPKSSSLGGRDPEDMPELPGLETP